MSNSGTSECGQQFSNENIKQPSPNTEYDKPKTTGECGIFQMFVYHGNKCTREIKYSVTIAKAACNRKKTLFSCKMDSN